IDTRILTPEAASVDVSAGEVVLARVDVLDTLDGIEPGLDDIERLAAMAAGVPHPQTMHVTQADADVRLPPPVVVKPRHGSWGRDVFRCMTRQELRDCLETVRDR